MKNRQIPEFIEVEKVVVTEIKSLGLFSYQGINIRISDKERITINGMGRNENEAKLNFKQEWDNRSIDIFDRLVPVFCKSRIIYKQA